METTSTVGPTTWDDFVGQDRMKRRLRIHITGAFEGKRPMEHVLLAGPSGFGKTTLSNLIAGELTDPMVTLVMPMTRKVLIQELQIFPGGILFLDEIHALSRRDQEILLPVLDERASVYDDRGRRWPLGWVTVLAATTEPGKIIAPLHDRFPIRPDFVPYSDEELGKIVSLMAENVGVEFDVETSEALGRASGGIPRQGEQFVLAARDLEITLGRDPSVDEILDLCSVSEDGLTGLHRRYLEILAGQRGTAGEKTIESLLRVPVPVIRDLERLLLERGLIEYTPGGRQLTPQGVLKVEGRDETRAYARR